MWLSSELLELAITVSLKLLSCVLMFDESLSSELDNSTNSTLWFEDFLPSPRCFILIKANGIYLWNFEIKDFSPEPGIWD